MSFETVRDSVRLYIDMGFRPMPMYGIAGGRCRCGSSDCRPGKHAPPEVEDAWKEGAEYGPEDFDERDNIAIALGPWGGSDDWLVCLDVDGPFDLDTWLPGLPETLEQVSPRGRHFFYQVPAYTPLGNWTDALHTKPAGAVDIRYARGRVNVTPSRTGYGAYRWHRLTEPAPLPLTVLAVLYQHRNDRGLPVQASWWRGGKRP